MKLINENWDLFCSKLNKVKPTSKGIEASCPAHNDGKPSLNASYTDETILVKCHAGCTFEEIVSAFVSTRIRFHKTRQTFSLLLF